MTVSLNSAFNVGIAKPLLTAHHLHHTPAAAWTASSLLVSTARCRCRLGPRWCLSTLASEERLRSSNTEAVVRLFVARTPLIGQPPDSGKIWSVVVDMGFFSDVAKAMDDYGRRHKQHMVQQWVSMAAASVMHAWWFAADSC